MASTMFESTYAAYQEITKTFDIIWALDAGLWNLRTGAQKFYSEHTNATESQAKNELINGLQIHGINLKRIANELTWEYEEQYISELLLATVYKGNIIKNLIMDCQSYTKYRPNETTGGIFVSWRRKEELPTGA